MLAGGGPEEKPKQEQEQEVGIQGNGLLKHYFFFTTEEFSKY